MAGCELLNVSKTLEFACIDEASYVGWHENVADGFHQVSLGPSWCWLLTPVSYHLRNNQLC